MPATAAARWSPLPSPPDRSLSTWAARRSTRGPTRNPCRGRHCGRSRPTCSASNFVNDLPADSTVHWHGVALRNDMDGTPGLTQRPVRAGGRYTYEFTVPDPGTYWYHPHSGMQLGRGLYGVLIVDDPADPGRYDIEWTVVLDDWVDGTDRTPEDVLSSLTSMSGMNHRMGGMAAGDMGGMGTETMISPL